MLTVRLTVESMTETETETPRFEYLACPHCGTRYLARNQLSERQAKKARWFTCHRCNRRVRSVEATCTEREAELECV